MIVHLLIAGCVFLGQAGPPPADETAAAVRRLVHQLDAPRLAEREEAEAQLIKLGPAVLDHLPEPNPRTPPGVVHALGRVRQKLELALAEQSVQPSLVTLRGKQMPLAEVLSAIQQQTGNKIVDYRKEFLQQPAEVKLDVDFQKTPFWQALDRVLDQAGLTVYSEGEKGAISVVARSETHLPRSQGASYGGPFRFVPQRVIARRELRETIGDGLMLSLEAAWEPRINPILLKQKMEDLKATDERGNPMKIASPEAEPEFSAFPGSASVEVNIPLELPPRDVTAIASVKGTLTALLPGRLQTFRFKGLAEAKDVEQRKAGAIVKLQQVRKAGEVWEVRILVRFDEAGDALESHRGWILNNEAFLEGPDGKKVENAGLETTRRTETEVGIAYLFDLDRPVSEYTFVYKTPGLLISQQIPYEIKDVKLP